MTQILIVDDSVSVLKALEMSLKSQQYTLRSASNAEQALTSLEEVTPDLVIADILMPGMSGLELCAKLKATPQYADLPVLLISGVVNDEERQQAREVGAVDVVKKPFRADSLLASVRAALQGTAPQNAQAAPTSPAPESRAASPSLDQLLDVLVDKPGAVRALLIDQAGQVLSARGQAMPDETTLIQYFRFFCNVVNVSGQRQNDAWQSVLLEYARHTILLCPVSPRHSLAVVLRESSSANVVKYVLKNQRPQYESALGISEPGDEFGIKNGKPGLRA
ncbi:response regulator [Deinococcus sp.]|uniref:response regulator n=1 Tax=Deinococcus sp. TaxID=47478 RepID=UPI003B5A9886